MFKPLPTPREMAAWDRMAIEDYGLRGELLMENAARAACEVLGRAVGPLADARVLVLCGPGNNGGDGFAMARRLHDAGAEVLAVHTRAKHRYRGEARYHLDLARRAGVDCLLAERMDPSCLEGCDVVVDALLGTGFSGELRGEILDLVERVNALPRSVFVLAVDGPTGLDAATGRPCPEAVRAHRTATLHAAKLGMALPDAEQFTGLVEVCEIGIPARIAREHPPAHLLIGHDIMDLVPVPEPGMHKGTAGHVLVVGGSRGLAGAPQLAALAALRAGAGLATIACPDELEPSVRAASPDVMTLPLASGDDWCPQGMASELAENLDFFDAVVMGPGMGRSLCAAQLLGRVLPDLAKPCVLDADALFHLASMPELIPERAVLTPHPGEMARFFRTTPAEVQADRLGYARRLTELTGATVVLKGAGTIVAGPDGVCRLSGIDAPNLAIGGSGDVLAGLVCSLLARDVSPLPAACIGVYWHGYTGKLLEENYPGRGNLASEIADALPRTLKEYQC